MIDLNLKKLLSGILAITTLASTIPSTLAANIDTDGGNSKVPAKVTAEAAHFSVTVPTTLPITVQADGTVLTADNTKIVNNSMGPVSVTKIAVEGQNGWEIVDFTSDLTSQMNQKKFGLQLISNNVQPDGTCGLVGFNVIPGNSGSLDLPYDANIAVQTSAIEKQPIANVTFTVGWDELIRLNGYKIKDSDSNELDTYNVLKNGTIDLDAYSQMSDGSESPADGGTWSSTSTDVATVDPSTGVVSPAEVGTTTIKYEQDGLSAEVTLNVTVSGYNITVPESVETSDGKYQLDIGDEVQLSVAETYSITPGSWESNASDVLSVDTTGKITAKSGGDATITYTRGDKQASVNFHVIGSFTVTYISDGNGTVGESSRVFKEGSKLTFPTPTANTGYNFVKWVNSSTNEDVTTSTVVNDNITVKAVFDKQTFTVNYISGGNGTVSESSRTFKYGDKLTFPSTTPSKYYIFDKWVNSANSSTVTNSNTVTKNMTIKALFKVNEDSLSLYYNFTDDLNTSGWKVRLNSAFKSALNKSTPISYNEWNPGEPLPVIPSIYKGKPVTNMSEMFYVCNSVKSLDLSNFDTSKVTDMGYMFWDCSSLSSLDLSSFDTSKVTNMIRMFSDCSSLSSLDLSSFDTSAVTVMGSMFSGCSSLSSLDLSSFDTSKVTNMESMFYSCSNLTSLDLSSFNTSKVTKMNMMFSNCSSLTSLDLSSFDTSKASMRYMFQYCNKFNPAYGKTQEDCNRLNASGTMYSSKNFVVKS